MHPKLEKLAETTNISKNGMTDREKFEIMIHGNSALEHVYRTLVNFWTFDLMNRLGSKQSRPLSYRALVAFAKADSEFHDRIVMLLLDDLYRDEQAGWNHMMALHEILNAPFSLPPGCSGKSGEVREIWLKWGEENGFLVKKPVIRPRMTNFLFDSFGDFSRNRI